MVAQVGGSSNFNYVQNPSNGDWVPQQGSAGGALVTTAAGSGATGTDRSIVVTTTAQTFMPNNANRTRLIVKNDSATDVWLNLAGAATAAAGGGNYKLSANGGFLELEGYSGFITAIVATGTAAISARDW